jgi:hypothetical protein
MPQFHLDENVDFAIADGLVRRDMRGKVEYL